LLDRRPRVVQIEADIPSKFIAILGRQAGKTPEQLEDGFRLAVLEVIPAGLEHLVLNEDDNL